MTRAHANAFHLSTKKEPHDGTHHAALKTTSYIKPQTSNLKHQASPIVASVGSSIADVTANPLSA
jgi:hypothetical protein